MISFSDWNKKDKNTDYEIVKSRSGLPMFVLEPHQSLVGKTPAEIYWGREVARKAA